METLWASASSIVDDRVKALYEGTTRLPELSHHRPLQTLIGIPKEVSILCKQLQKAFEENEVVWSQQYHASIGLERRNLLHHACEQFKVTRPTAFILKVIRLCHFPHMNFMKLRIGEDISVINQKHPELEHILPGIDTYEMEESRLIVKTASRAIDLARIDHLGKSFHMQLHELAQRAATSHKSNTHTSKNLSAHSLSRRQVTNK